MAKLVEVGGPARSIAYAADFTPGQYRLVELPSDILAEVLASQSSGTVRLSVRGDEAEEAVLCTRTATYVLREAQVSNSFVLVAPSKGRRKTTDDGEAADEGAMDIDGVADPNALDAVDRLSSTIELVKVPPRLAKLEHLLNLQPYVGPTHEAGVNAAETYDEGDLQALVQASDEELAIGIRRLNTIRVNGKLRVLEAAYAQTLLSAVLVAVMRHGWDAAAIPLAECIAELADEFPQEIVLHTLRVFSEVSSDVPITPTMAISRRACCRFQGERVFRTGATKMRREDFYDAWRLLLHGVFDPQDSDLEGCALFETARGEEYVIEYSSKQLSLDPLQRFSQLFAVRETWVHEDFVPYLRDIASSDVERDQLLLKYTRSFTNPDNKRKMYSIRFQS